MGQSNYTLTEMARLFNMSRHRVEEWKKGGDLPTTVINGRQRLPADFVEPLHNLLRLELLYSRSAAPRVATLVRLYSIGYRLSRQDVESNKALRVQLKRLLEDGRVVHFPQLIKALRDHVAKETIYTWKKNGHLPAVHINGKNYITRQVYNYIVWWYEKCKTTVIVSRLSGYDVSWITAQARNGAWKGLHGPAGRTWRFAPETVEQICKARTIRYLSTKEAATQLGISHKQLRRYMETNPIPNCGPKTAPRIPESFVTEWKRMFTTLNPGFEWLQHILGAQKTSKTVTSKQVMRLLQVSNPTLLKWCRQGLLPFYTVSFVNAARQRNFVYAYVVGLVRFANAKVQKKQAIEYQRRCAQARAIV